jgi:hypothetical protein
MTSPSPPSSPESEVPSDSGGTTWTTSILKATTSSAKFLGTAASEWLPFLLDQPTQPPFAYNAQFSEEFGRASRLIVFVLVIAGLVVGGINLLSGRTMIAGTLKEAFGLFIIAVIISLVYKPFAYITGVRIQASTRIDTEPPSKPLSTRQIAFSVLYTFVPWLPILAFIRATVVATRGALLDFLLIAPFICFLYVCFNFYKAIKMITNSSRFRVSLSVLLPIILSILYVVVSSLM